MTSLFNEKKQWILGKVVKTLSGTDGKIRSVVLIVFSDVGHNRILKRPIERLHPLEVWSVGDVIDYFDVNELENNDELDIPDTTEQPRRSDADKSILIRRLMCEV